MKSQLSEAKSIFLNAVEIGAPGPRQAYLEAACAGREALRREVDDLLRHCERKGSFLESPASALAATSDEPPTERPGTVIGPYKLLQAIGEGGMGTVYMAEQQEPVRRLVALKIIKPGMDSAQVIARFEAERQALALMDHPNIAKVLDADTTETGRPYFVMELVKGIPITRFCDDNQLTPRQRLELFVPVCQAVQHAHTKGVIHRDLKPSNVLVALYDDRPVPKVIDFGVAKATSQKLTERTLFTAFGSFIGTLEYMSPEQAKLNALDIDTRSDIYALGVLLYELLTGNTPLEHERLKQTALDELLRTIREEEPPKPSTRLSQSGEALATISARRGTEPAKLGQVLRGELDWIVMKALEKERTRRYETANGLAHDLQRYLADEPVEACPPAAGYKLRKFARKHQKLLAVAAAFAAVLLLGVTASTWQAVRATQAETLAQANEQQATANAVQAQEKEQEANANAAKAEKNEKAAKQKSDEVQALNAQLRSTLYVAHINLVQRACEAGNFDRARELLEQHRPKPGESDLRNFEWHYLNRLCHSALPTLKGHTGVVHSVAYSPDGKRLASAGGVVAGGELKVWDAQTGRELLSLPELNGKLWSVAFSPDGKWLAGSSTDGTIKVWDAQMGQELHSLVQNPRGIRVPVMSVAFSPDSKRLASAGGRRDVKVWDMQTGQALLTLEGGQPGTGQPTGIAFSPDGKRLASASGDKTVKIWDAQTGEVLRTLEGLNNGVRSVAFSPDGKRLASASGDETVKVWDAQAGQKPLPFKEGTILETSVAFSPDGKRLASSITRREQGKLVFEGNVRDAQTGQELFPIKNALSCNFSPDGKRLASRVASNGGGVVKVWDAQTGQELLTLQGGSGPVAFSPDGKRLTGLLNGTGKVTVWDAQTGKELFALDRRLVNSVALSPDGKRLAVAFPKREQGTRGKEVGEVKVWDAQTGEELLTLQGGGWGVVFSPDGRLAGGVGVDGKMWDAQTGQELLFLKGAGGNMVFSPDGKRLASQGDAMKVWDAQTGKELFTLKGHNAAVQNMAFSPDSKRLVSASPDATVKVWDAQTGQELLTFEGHGGSNGVAFSPDGHRLAGGGPDGTLKIWNATPLPAKP
jgi:WD40 repeat protein/serine/threonine protein kinase